jgi:choline dehydrogenase-like flavoprotein
VLTLLAMEPEGCLGRTWPRVAGGWARWETVGPELSGEFIVAQNDDGHLEAFGVGPDGRLGHGWEIFDPDHDGWSSWEAIGPPIAGRPAVGRNASGHLELFAIGRDGRLGHIWQINVIGYHGWSGWEPLLAVRLNGDPAVAANADGHLELFAIGSDGRLGHVWQHEPDGRSGWGVWHAFGPAITSSPTVARSGDGRLEVLARGPTGRLGRIAQLDRDGLAGWSEWTELDVEIDGAPVACVDGGGRIAVFATASGGRLGWTRLVDADGCAGWGAWEDLGVALGGPPAVCCSDDGRLEVFAVDAAGCLGRLRKIGDAGEWAPWEELGLDTAGAQLAVCGCAGPGVEPAEPGRVGAAARAAEVVRADCCVIGAGPAGITLADTLGRTGARVLLLESGRLDRDPASQELSRGVARGPIIKGYWNYLAAGRRRQVGGSTAIWGRGVLMPFRELEFEPRPWVPHSGWVLTAQELEPFYRTAAERAGLAPFPALRAKGGLMHAVYRHPPEANVFRSLFVEALGTPGVRAELGTTALELELAGDRVQAVRCAGPDGRVLRVEADTFVLAAGAVENARLLLLNAQALPAPSPVVGRYFMEHPHARVAWARFPDVAGLEALFDEDGTGRREVLALPDARQREESLLSAMVELRRLGAVVPGRPLDCRLYVRAEQAPDPDSAVTLGHGLDRLGYPRAVLDWRLGERDWTSLVRATTLVVRELEDQYGVEAVMEVRPDTPWPGRPLGPNDEPDATWGYHHMGTTRMADDPDEGVVDRDCRVHGTANLFAAGSSVFPTGGAANPTLTIVALAQRLGAHLAGSTAAEPAAEGDVATSR